MTTALEKLIKLLRSDEEIREPEKFLEQVIAREKDQPDGG